MVLDSSYVIAGLAMLGRFLMVLNFNTTYVFTAELFPTPLRSSAMGTGSMFSRVGGILAPIVASLVSFIFHLQSTFLKMENTETWMLLWITNYIRRYVRVLSRHRHRLSIVYLWLQVEVWHPLPVLIMGTCGFIGCVILLFMPETLNKPLPNNIEEIEQVKNNPSFFQKLWKTLRAPDKPRQADIVLKKVCIKNAE